MSLGIIISGPEGIVLAAESRVTLGANNGSAFSREDFERALQKVSRKIKK